jgi:hypothetical protein
MLRLIWQGNAFEKDCGSEGEKILLAQLVGMVPAFYGNQRFVAIFTGACQ